MLVAEGVQKLEACHRAGALQVAQRQHLGLRPAAEGAADLPPPAVPGPPELPGLGQMPRAPAADEQPEAPAPLQGYPPHSTRLDQDNCQAQTAANPSPALVSRTP